MYTEAMYRKFRQQLENKEEVIIRLKLARIVNHMLVSNAN